MREIERDHELTRICSSLCWFLDIHVLHHAFMSILLPSIYLTHLAHVLYSFNLVLSRERERAKW